MDYFVPLDFSGLLCTPGKSYGKVLLGTIYHRFLNNMVKWYWVPFNIGFSTKFSTTSSSDLFSKIEGPGVPYAMQTYIYSES